MEGYLQFSNFVSLLLKHIPSSLMRFVESSINLKIMRNRIAQLIAVIVLSSFNGFSQGNMDVKTLQTIPINEQIINSEGLKTNFPNTKLIFQIPATEYRLTNLKIYDSLVPMNVAQFIYHRKFGHLDEAQTNFLLKLAMFEFISRKSYRYHLTLFGVHSEKGFDLDQLFKRISLTEGNFKIEAKAYTDQTEYNYLVEYLDVNKSKFTIYFYIDKISFRIKRSLSLINDSLYQGSYLEPFYGKIDNEPDGLKDY